MEKKKKTTEKYMRLAENMATINQVLLVLGWAFFFVLLPLVNEGLAQGLSLAFGVDRPAQNWFFRPETFVSLATMVALSIVNWKLEVRYLKAVPRGDFAYAKKHLSYQKNASVIACVLVIVRCFFIHDFLVPSFVFVLIGLVDFLSSKKQLKEVQRLEIEGETDGI